MTGDWRPAREVDWPHFSANIRNCITDMVKVQVSGYHLSTSIKKISYQVAENITLSLSLWICWSEQTVQSALYDSFVTTVVACTAISSVVSWSLDPSELLNFQNCQAQNGRANREGGQVPEMCIFYDFQIAMENVHSEMYTTAFSSVHLWRYVSKPHTW